MTNPRTCECGEPGRVIETRQKDDCAVHRYRCLECSKRWATIEVRNTQAAAETSVVRQMRERMADQLIELAQKLMK